MTDRFMTCLAFVLDREGGYVDDQLDRGGATNRGITQAEYDRWRDAHGLDEISVALIADDEVATIYRVNYWEAARCGTLPAPLDLFVFDAAVQHGPRKAIQLLQRAAGVIDTGYFGPMTMAAVKSAEWGGRVGVLLRECMKRRRDYYAAIIAYDPAQKRFSRGWANRMAALESALMTVSAVA